MQLTYNKKKPKINTLDFYVIFSIFVLLLYTVISQIVAIVYNVQLNTLTTCFFAAFGGEILSACLIKIFKLKKPEETTVKTTVENNTEEVEDHTEIYG